MAPPETITAPLPYQGFRPAFGSTRRARPDVWLIRRL